MKINIEERILFRLKLVSWEEKEWNKWEDFCYNLGTISSFRETICVDLGLKRNNIIEVYFLKGEEEYVKKVIERIAKNSGVEVEFKKEKKKG